MKSPVGFVVPGKVVPRVSLVRVTAAFGMTAPCASLTLPTMVAVACACAFGAYATRSAANRAAPARVCRRRRAPEFDFSVLVIDTPSKLNEGRPPGPRGTRALAQTAGN